MDAGGVKVQETKRAHGLLVALLLSLLLGPGPAAAADVRRPHVETADSGKATLVVRSLNIAVAAGIAAAEALRQTELWPD